MDYSRISVRLFQLTDAKDCLSWATDDKVTRYLRWNTNSNRGDAIHYIREVAIPHPWRHSICLDDRSIRYVSVRPVSGLDHYYVGYVIGSDDWGLGIATAALKMAIPCVFEKFSFLVRLENLVEENHGSQRVLEKVGFVKEGFLRKYGFTKGEMRNIHAHPQFLEK